MSNAERWQRFRELPSDIQQRLDRLPALLEQEGVQLAYLFGSLAQGRTGQDVDLAVLVQAGPAYPLRETCIDWLGTERVDLVDLRRAGPVLRFKVLRTGRLLYATDEETRTQFELDTLRLYRDTIPLRRRQREVLKRRMAQWSSNAR